MTTCILRASLTQVESTLRQAIALIGYRPQKAALFIKPNLSNAGPPGQGLYTDPLIVEALVRIFDTHEVVIGEGCVVGRSAAIAFQGTAYADLATHPRVSLLDLDEVKRYAAQWDFGVMRLPELLLSHEYINVAKMKTHIQTGVSLSLKNQKGLLLPVDKKRFHRKGLHSRIRALGSLVQPDLIIVDGIVALEGNGPWRFGTPVDMNLLIVGDDMVEVDNVCREIMGFAPEEAPHIPPMDELHTLGLPIEEVRRKFILDFPGYFTYHNLYEHISDSCSGCNISIYHAMKQLRSSWWGRVRFQLHAGRQRTDIIMGHPEKLPPNHGRIICLGDCTRLFAREHNLTFVAGCPPDPENLVRIF
ncbi:MAG: DUF362 domain-containing protein [Chloroflexota bacterium]